MPADIVVGIALIVDLTILSRKVSSHASFWQQVKILCPNQASDIDTLIVRLEQVPTVETSHLNLCRGRVCSPASSGPFDPWFVAPRRLMQLSPASPDSPHVSVSLWQLGGHFVRLLGSWASAPWPCSCPAERKDLPHTFPWTIVQKQARS